ncbi:hypothetical protein J3998_07250 [Thiomicrorhabdus sp. 6S2-11]|uniref:Uncharacterized protein n=1 Tax=Thiomicrorhabdus marina TaxID=2818442 RepID=A0ABS3Q4W7_9GAMM|nr:hypothetical protein [Thiomicrorhabdus marina]MBO1927373.1 hypothetical protein [Thiomicrorhabdus marina]
MTDFMNESGRNNEESKLDNQSLLVEQSNIVKEFRTKQVVTPLRFNPSATSVNVPKFRSSPTFIVTLNKSDDSYRKLLFGVLNAAHYLYFMTDDYADSSKEKLIFFRWLFDYIDSVTITKENCAKLFKNFEAWRVKKHNVKTQSTGLKFLKVFTQHALSFSEFSSTLTDYEREYLHQQSLTQPAPIDEVDAINLNYWFSQHTWLRREDVGIGHELYSRLGSPRALVTSFRITIETLLIHLQACKDALISAFEQAGISEHDIPEIAPKQKEELGAAANYRVIREKTSILNTLREKLNPFLGEIPHLNDAITLLVFVHTKPQHRAFIADKFQKNEVIPVIHTKVISGFLSSKKDVLIFDMAFLQRLAIYTADTANNKRKKPVPVCEAESFLFSYLMAFQTVQPSDISKLTLRDFKFVRRRNGNITHIESDYFKGRANTIHQVKTLQTKEDIGRAVLRYLEDMTRLKSKDIPLVQGARIEALTFSPSNTVGLLFLLCQEAPLSTVLAQKHASAKVASVFVEAIAALLKNGLSCRTKAGKSSDCQTRTTECFFAGAHIKTSSVYAHSDTFDPTRLSNYRSHSNQTERENYLTEHNEEWENLTGRVTRAVMRDLTVNVFCPSEEDKQVFHSDYTHAVEYVKNRSDEVLAVLKIVTEQQSGRVDEFGFITKGSPIENDLPDTLYLHDSAHTVMKLRHFLDELEAKHDLLLQRAPEYLFFTALPQAEWIECLLAKNKAKDLEGFSEESLSEGLSLYQRWKKELPPHFSAQLS